MCRRRCVWRVEILYFTRGRPWLMICWIRSSGLVREYKLSLAIDFWVRLIGCTVPIVCTSYLGAASACRSLLVEESIRENVLPVMIIITVVIMSCAGAKQVLCWYYSRVVGVQVRARIKWLFIWWFPSKWIYLLSSPTTPCVSVRTSE